MQIKSLLLIISGSVAAYKALELIRLLRQNNIEVDAILTRSGAEFVTPLSVSALTERECYTHLFNLKDEVEMGHIQLSRKNDAILVAPASADILAKMAQGIADDLATTALLATDKPVFIAPAMNHRMWHHPATQRNIEQLHQDGVLLIAPTEGNMACGETGTGRMAEPEAILQAILPQHPPSLLKGKRAIVTVGATQEPIDPVRYISNHSSGKQGVAIAQALAAAGAEVQLVAGHVNTTLPQNLSTYKIQTAQEMYDCCQSLLPADIAVCCAAVSDWRVAKVSEQKQKKQDGQTALQLELVQNPDILQMFSHSPTRPELVIGFAAETEKLHEHARQKMERKGCDWLLANDVSEKQVFGKDDNHVLFLPANAEWHGSKRQIAQKLTDEIIHYFTHPSLKKESA